MSTHKIFVTNKDLREFGFIFGVILVLIFGLLLPWILDAVFPLWPWGVLLVTTCMAIICPVSLKPFYKAWMLFGTVMGWINTRLILGIVFYVVFMPVGLIMKIFGKDLLSIKLDGTLNTYRVTHDNKEKDNMENPF